VQRIFTEDERRLCMLLKINYVIDRHGFMINEGRDPLIERNYHEYDVNCVGIVQNGKNVL